MSTDWNSGWAPPGAQPTSPSSQQDTGWDWSWLFPSSPAGPARYGPAGRYGAPPKGDDDWSWLTNFFAGGSSDEERLANEIYMKMGGPTPGGKATTPNAYRLQIAQTAAHRAVTDPAYREQLAQSMGWNLANPHVAYWVMHGSNLPSDPTSAGLAPGEKPPSTAKQPAAATTPTATIGSPFAPSAFQGYGYGYQAVLAPQFASAAGVSSNPGLDVDVPMGTQLNAMFTGTVVAAGFNGPYGNTVLVKMANGYTYRYAHMEQLAPGLQVGATVAVGQELGLAGMTGNASGPHVNIEIRDPQGKTIDPTPIIGALIKGDTTGAAKFMSDYQSAASAVGGPFLTSDGHLIYPGSQDYDVFFAAQQLWRKRYGGDPPWSFVSSLIAQGNTTSEQIQSAMDQMSSDITGMNWGQRDAFSSDVSGAATKAWDRPVPDATLKQLAALGITTPGQIQGWIASHPASALDPSTYAQYFDATNPQTQELWKQPPSPDMIAHIHKQMQAGPQGA